MTEVTNVLMAGVGGQGILLASEVLTECLMLAGFDVKKAEVHGMAQRGGNVVSHVRFGAKVFSPTIPAGEVDILFAFELLEAYRNIGQLRQGGRAIINNLRIAPPGVNVGLLDYPVNLEHKLPEIVASARVLPAMEIAEQAGDLRAVNMVLLGALANELTIEEGCWQEAMAKIIPEKLIELNQRAFSLGRTA